MGDTSVAISMIRKLETLTRVMWPSHIDLFFFFIVKKAGLRCLYYSLN